MTEFEYLQKKRLEVLEEIKPICEVFGINDYDYIISESSPREVLKLNGVKIGCSCNSISAVKNELIGFIFLRTWGRDRSMGTFDKQSRNVIKRYWLN